MEGRPYLYAPLRSASKWRMVYGGRQVGKSVIIAVDQGTRAVISAPRRGLYVAPTQIQAREFSRAKFDDVYRRSPVLSTFFDRRTRSVTEKEYILGSRLTLRYAFRHADRIRGISADDIYPDEVQDMDRDVLPVIYEAAFRSKDPHYLLSGTQKSHDGPLQEIISQEGVHLDWAIPCDRHTPRKWNVLLEKNLDMKTFGLVCRYCQKPIDICHEDAQWVITQSAPVGLDDPMEVYRICQPMEPSADLKAAVRKVKTGAYSVARYKNEVWALPFQHADQPLTRDMIKACCWDTVKGWRFSMNDFSSIKKFSTLFGRVFQGTDWGAGTEDSRTVSLIGGMYHNHLVVAYGELVQPPDLSVGRVADCEVDRVMQLHDEFNVEKMGCDYGLGYGRNMSLIKKYGIQKVFRIMFLNMTRPYKFDEEEWFFKLWKTLFYDKVVNLIKRRKILFPPWSEFGHLAEDMVNIRREGGEGTFATYFHPKGKPDDAFSALVFLVFVVAFCYKMSDILSFRKED